MAGTQGLGDVIANTLKKVGIQPCEGCQKRQEWLNQMSRKGVVKSGEQGKKVEEGSRTFVRG